MRISSVPIRWEGVHLEAALGERPRRNVNPSGVQLVTGCGTRKHGLCNGGYVLIEASEGCVNDLDRRIVVLVCSGSAQLLRQLREGE